jgi:hypothetical protein
MSTSDCRPPPKLKRCHFCIAAIRGGPVQMVGGGPRRPAVVLHLTVHPVTYRTVAVVTDWLPPVGFTRGFGRRHAGFQTRATRNGDRL